MFSILFCSSQIRGQDVETKMVTSICECITAKEEIVNLDIDLGMCMFTATSGNEKAIKKEMGIDLSDLNNYEAFGEQIGVKLALKCPKFLQIITEVMESEDPVSQSVEDEVLDTNDRQRKKLSSKEVVGKIQSINHDDFTTLVFEAENGRKMKFYWMGYFEGSELLTKVKKKEVELKYVNMEVYSAAIQDYRTIKVIQKISGH